MINEPSLLKKKSITILMADDDEDDRMLTEEAMKASRLLNDIYFVTDGEQLCAYLEGQGKYANRESFPMPGLILLDLNMPRMDGREALQRIKQNSELRRIPVVILTTSEAEEDMLKTYDLGAASYITKPVAFDALVQVLQTLGEYWVEVVQLPASRSL